jgi:hypothetical protein
MKTIKMNAKPILIAGLILVLLLGASCTTGQDNNVGSIVGPHRFNLVGWEFKTVLGDLKAPNQSGNVSDESGTVIEYFSLTQRINLLKSQMKISNDGQQASTALKTELDRLEAQKKDLEGAIVSRGT